jgi:hypothetical protein
MLEAVDRALSGVEAVSLGACVGGRSSRARYMSAHIAGLFAPARRMELALAGEFAAP